MINPPWLFPRLALLATLVLSLAVLAACQEGDADTHVEAVLAEDVEVWRFAIEETRDSVQDAYAQRFGELVHERTDGRVQVAVYPYGTLGTSDHVTEQLRMGMLHFAMASPGHLGTLIPEVQALLLHYIFSDDEYVNKRALMEASDLRRTFDELYEEKGFRLLSIYQEGWMAWTANREIRTPADFHRQRIRVMTSPVLLDTYEQYGASPTPMAYGEVYSGLQLGLIDAQDNPIFAIQEMRFYEVNDYLIMPNHAPFVTTAVTNREFFDSLSPERQQMVLEIIEELQPYIFETQRRFNAERLELIREGRPQLNIIDDLTEEEREAFRQASLPVRDQYVRRVGPIGETILEQLRTAIREAEEKYGEED